MCKILLGEIKLVKLKLFLSLWDPCFHKTTESLSCISLVINFYSTIISDGAWSSFRCKCPYQGQAGHGQAILAAVSSQVKAIGNSSKPQDSLMTPGHTGVKNGEKMKLSRSYFRWKQSSRITLLSSW